VKVTIIPRGRALGAAWYLPEERQITTREQLLDEMAYALGGRASEELVFGKVSTGALSDLEKITKQAYAMVSFFGMSDKVGNVSFYDSSGQTDFGFTKPYSEKTAELIDHEVKKIIEESYERAKEVLKAHIDGLTVLAELLLEKEVIFSEDLEKIFGKRKADQIKDVTEKNSIKESIENTEAVAENKGKLNNGKNGPEQKDKLPVAGDSVKSLKKSKKKV
jgi:cell division protease FtsH